MGINVERKGDKAIIHWSYDFEIEPHLDGKVLADTTDIINNLSGMSPRGKGSDDVIKLVLSENVKACPDSRWKVVRKPTEHMDD